jgi:hypothetical protein
MKFYQNYLFSMMRNGENIIKITTLCPIPVTYYTDKVGLTTTGSQFWFYSDAVEYHPRYSMNRLIYYTNFHKGYLMNYNEIMQRCDI